MDAALQSPASTPRARNTGLTVVKLGGSVVRDAALEPWLEVIGDARQPIVIVPGGGTLADEVRACQRQLGFADATAHRMALLAMDQLAWMGGGCRFVYLSNRQIYIPVFYLSIRQGENMTFHLSIRQGENTTLYWSIR